MDKEFWKDRPVLVTGCTGFLGTWMTLRLVDAGASVVGLVRDRVAESNFFRSGLDERIVVVPGSVTDAMTVERVLNEYSIDTCFHLAAQAIVGVANRSPISSFESNIQGTWVLLEAVRNSTTVQRVVVASSDKAYGTYPEDALPYHEEYALRGEFPYDVSKACSDLIAQSYYNTYFRQCQPRSDFVGRNDVGVALGITRCGNLFGGGDLNFGRIVPDTIWSLLGNDVPTIRSHGKHIRDFLYVLDAVDAYLLLAEHLREDGINGEAFNFALETPMSVLEIVKRISDVMHADPVQPIVRGTEPAAGEILSQYLSAQKARERLAWSPRYTLDQGLCDTVDWFRFWRDTDLSCQSASSLFELNIQLIRRFEES